MLFTTTIKQRYYLEQDANDRQDKKNPKKTERSSSIYFLQEPCADLNGVGGGNQSYYIHIVKLLLMIILHQTPPPPPGKKISTALHEGLSR